MQNINSFIHQLTFLLEKEPTSPQQISSDESGEELLISQSPKLQASNKSKDASSSSNEEVYQISQSPLRKKENKQSVISPKL